MLAARGRYCSDPEPRQRRQSRRHRRPRPRGVRRGGLLDVLEAAPSVIRLGPEGCWFKSSRPDQEQSCKCGTLRTSARGGRGPIRVQFLFEPCALGPVDPECEHRTGLAVPLSSAPGPSSLCSAMAPARQPRAASPRRKQTPEDEHRRRAGPRDGHGRIHIAAGQPMADLARVRARHHTGSCSRGAAVTRSPPSCRGAVWSSSESASRGAERGVVAEGRTRTSPCLLRRRRALHAAGRARRASAVGHRAVGHVVELRVGVGRDDLEAVACVPCSIPPSCAMKLFGARSRRRFAGRRELVDAGSCQRTRLGL